MKITIIRTTTTLLSEDEQVQAVRQRENYLIEPAARKILRHKGTGQLFYTGLCVSQKHKITQYEEIQDSRATALES